MKKTCSWFIISICSLFFCKVAAQPQCYLQLYPNDNSKIIFQILPDKDYTDVAIYINFYDDQNNAIKLNKKFAITTSANKYIRQSDGVYSVILTTTFPNVDHISLSGIYEKVTGFEFQRLPGNPLSVADIAFNDGYAFPVNTAINAAPLQDVSLAQPVEQKSSSRGAYTIQPKFFGRTIRASYNCDLEKDGESTDGDFQWNMDNSIQGNIQPHNGAVFYVYGYCPNCFDSQTYESLKNLESQGAFSSNSIYTPVIRKGAILAYITRNHLYGMMRIDALTQRKAQYSTALDLKISFKTLGN